MFLGFILMIFLLKQYVITCIKIHTKQILTFNLSYFYTQLPRPVDSTYYNGAMEEVMFDGKPLGLWNFVAGENNFKGAIERSVSARFSLEL